MVPGADGGGGQQGGAFKMIQAPLADGSDDRPERPSGIGERVVLAAGVAPIERAGYQPRLFEALEPVCQDVGGDAFGRREELPVATLAQQQIPDDEQRPAVPEEIQRAGDGAARAARAAAIL